MKRIDVLILAAIVLAAAGSVLGLVTYEDGRGAEFDITWATREELLEAERATVSGAGEAEIALPVAFRNLTTAEVTVSIASAPSTLAPIAVHIELRIPGVNDSLTVDGQLAPASGGTEFVIPIELADLPNATSVRAADPEAAEAQAGAAAGSDAGVGNWTILVSLAPTAPDPIGAITHSIDVTATLVVYEPEATVRTPEVQR